MGARMNECYLCNLIDGTLRPRGHDGRHGSNPISLTVWSGTDTSEGGPSLDEADATVAVIAAPTNPRRRQLVLTASIPNLNALDDDQGLWTVVVEVSGEEATRIARDLQGEV